MLITKKRIRSLDKYLPNIDENKKLYVTAPKPEGFQGVEGQEFLLPPSGPVTRFNREGKYKVYTDEQKEPRDIEHDYSILDWHGNPHSGSCIQTRYCYPRDFIHPPLEMVFLAGSSIHSAAITKKEASRLLHIINMFLEAFGSCEIIDEESTPINTVPIKILQWQILPPGEYPWDIAKEYLPRILSNRAHKSINTIEEHHKVITKHMPDFMAIGQNSFSGYVVYGFKNKGLYIFESSQLDNATYIFNDDWEELSKCTKKELIEGNLFKHRFLHNATWRKSINSTLK